MKLKHAIAGLAAGLVTSATLAIVTVADNVRRGDQGVLYDSVTQMDWLRGPVGLSGCFACIFDNLLPFHIASAGDVGQFFTDAGLSNFSGSVVVRGGAPEGPDVRAFQFLSNAWLPGTPNHIDGPVSIAFQLFVVGPEADIQLPTDLLSYGSLSTAFHGADTPNVFEWNAIPGAGFAPAGDLFFYGAGLALVRPHISLVPEPAAFALMLCGLALLGARVRGCASRAPRA